MYREGVDLVGLGRVIMRASGERDCGRINILPGFVSLGGSVRCCVGSGLVSFLLVVLLLPLEGLDERVRAMALGFATTTVTIIVRTTVGNTVVIVD